MMTEDRFLLRDDQWDRIKDVLPGNAGDCGVTATDNRLFVEAVLWMGRAGAPWRDLPAVFGAWHNVTYMFASHDGARQEFGNASQPQYRKIRTWKH